MKDNQKIELFVPGRLCLFGEHSDWAGTAKSMNSDITPGRAIVTGIEQGIYGTAYASEQFAVYSNLDEYGENYFQPVNGAEQKDGDYTINQGYVETSNVQTVQEMVEMISVSRQYESNQRIITTIDSTLEIVSKQLGRV